MAGENGVSESGLSPLADQGDNGSQAGAVAGANPDDDIQQDQNENEQIPAANPDDLHLTEEWFHGRITREEAVSLLGKHKELGNGVFLVRESTTFIGDYSLSF